MKESRKITVIGEGVYLNFESIKKANQILFKANSYYEKLITKILNKRISKRFLLHPSYGAITFKDYDKLEDNARQK